MPDQKVILVLIDGLGYSTAVREMGYLEGLVERRLARRWKMHSSLPSMSRPLYETVHTGLAPHDHGIVSNKTVRASNCPNIFSVVRAHDRRTAAAANYWMSELYIGVPFDHVEGREVKDEEGTKGNIQFARFYSSDKYPDEDLYYQANRLVRHFAPDYLLIHPMECDDLGHLHGGESEEYRRAAAGNDDLLSRHVPSWLEAGYHVLVTADHGMCRDGHHGGTADSVRDIAFYHIGAQEGGVAEETACQLAVAPTILTLMDIKPPSTMTTPSLI